MIIHHLQGLSQDNNSGELIGCVHSQDQSYDLQDRGAFAQFLIDADIRLVPWKSSCWVYPLSILMGLELRQDTSGWEKLPFSELSWAQSSARTLGTLQPQTLQ